MPMVMEKKDWMQTVANVGSADGVWFENVAGDAGDISVSLPEGGDYQVILVKIDSTAKNTFATRSAYGAIKHGQGLKIGAMKEEIHLPENFDQTFEDLDGRAASMFSGMIS